VVSVGHEARRDAVIGVFEDIKRMDGNGNRWRGVETCGEENALI
jgi:hypothetical protein